MDGLVNPLLGKPAIESLGFLGFLQKVDFGTEWVNKFPTFFQGLGSFRSKVKIALREESSAFCQIVPRRVAAARGATENGEARGDFLCRRPYRLVLAMCCHSQKERQDTGMHRLYQT